MESSQSAEYRISPIERLVLFTNDISLITQVINRLTISYCDLSIQGRVLIPLRNSNLNDEYYKSVKVKANTSNTGNNGENNTGKTGKNNIGKTGNNNSDTESKGSSTMKNSNISKRINNHDNNYTKQYEIIHKKPSDFYLEGEVSLFPDSIGDYRLGLGCFVVSLSFIIILVFLSYIFLVSLYYSCGNQFF
jgi:hypothetical protein